MKFLNHLDFNENEARKMKMYRTTTSYTPSPAAAGNIILDTGANIPKWWDGTAWRDFSYGTTGTMNWNIQSDGGSNIQVDQGDTLDIAGGTLITTATSGSATAPVVTINHNNVTRTNDDTATKTFAENDGSTLLVVTGITTNAQGHITEVDRTTVGAGSSSYTISSINPTGSNAVAIALDKANGGTTYAAFDKIEIQDGTYIDNTLVNSGTIKADLSAVDGTTTGTSQRFLTKDNTWATPSFTTNTNDNTLYNFSLGALIAGANEAVLTLDASSGDDDTIKFKGTTNEIEITTPATGDAGTLQIGLPDNVVITGNLTVNGSTTTVNSNTVEIGDSIITLNSDETGTPSQNGGIEIERGTSTNVNLLWNETTDKWTVSDGSNSYNVIQNLFSTVTGDSGTATANSYTTALAVTGSGGITTTASNQGIVIAASAGLGAQNLYATFIGDSGTTTANSTTDTLDIEGGNGITTTASNDKVTIALDDGYQNSALDIFKTIAVSNTATDGTVTSQAVAAVADTATDTLNLRGLDASIALTSSNDPEYVQFKSSILATTKLIDVSELNGEQLKAKITHGFGTQDVVVQLWGITTKEQVYANVWNYETNNNSVLVQFSAQPQEDIKCVIMAVNLDAGSTISYPAS